MPLSFHTLRIEGRVKFRVVVVCLFVRSRLDERSAWCQCARGGGKNLSKVRTISFLPRTLLSCYPIRAQVLTRRSAVFRVRADTRRCPYRYFADLPHPIPNRSIHLGHQSFHILRNQSQSSRPQYSLPFTCLVDLVNTVLP